MRNLNLITICSAIIFTFLIGCDDLVRGKGIEIELERRHTDKQLPHKDYRIFVDKANYNYEIYNLDMHAEFPLADSTISI